MALKIMQLDKLLKTLTFEKIAVFFVLALITLNICIAILDSKGKYFNHNFKNELDKIEEQYLNSQYISKEPKYIIPDEIINTYAGWKYVNGVNPVLIASDTPPLGRYLIGSSITIFNNENYITLIFSVLSLFLMYFLGMQIFKSRIISLIPPLLFSFEPIFKNQIIYSPLLDIMQLAFLLLIFYFFNKGFTGKKEVTPFILVSLFLGLFVATKFFATGITIVAAIFFVLILNKNFGKLKIYIFTLPLSLLVLLFSYIRVLAFNYSIMEFLGIQKYVFLYHKSQLILPFTIWPLLLFNKWFVWYGNNPIISDPQWQISWPILTLLTVVSCILYFFKKIKKQKSIEILLVWSLLYILFFSFGQITSRYLVIFIPVMYIVSLYIVKELVLNYSKIKI